MAVELPKFEDEYGLFLKVCGKLKNPVTKAQAKEPKSAPVTSYKIPSGKAFIRAWLTGKKETYLHVDCAISSLFPHGKEPKVTHEKDDILSTIVIALGGEIDSQVEACFEVPLSELPEKGTIRSLYGEQKSADISMQITGAEVSFTGAPLQWIRWNIRKAEEMFVARVWLSGERVTVISDKYLLDSWDWINDQFSIFVLGRRKDA